MYIIGRTNSTFFVTPTPLRFGRVLVQSAAGSRGET